MYSLAKNRPWVLVMLTGLLLAAAFPPSPLGPLAFIAFVPLLVLLETIEGRSDADRAKSWLRRRWSGGYARSFRYTYFAFLLWNVLCCYWLTLTMVGAQDFSEGLEYFMGGFMAITVNPLLMSIPFWIFMRAKRHLPPVMAAACLAALWIAFEYLHFRWDLSWSWLTIGHALTMWAPLIQHAEFTGVSGVGLHIMVANVLVYATYRHFALHGKLNRRWAGAALGWILLPLILYPLIMRPGRAVFDNNGTMAVRIVQPSIDPYLKFEDGTREQQYRLFRDLSTASGADSIDMVLLPETALTYPGGINEKVALHDTLCHLLWRAVEDHQYSILTGLIERKVFPDSLSAPASASRVGNNFWDTYNAALMMKPGQQMQFYEKTKLVPFVERTPFLEDLHQLRKRYGIDLTMGFGGYGLPDSLKMVETHQGVKVGTLICYESEFSEVSRAHVNRGAELLVVITNDGWWGQTSGYIQHAYLARLRAIEMRRDIARSANTGRSLFVDAKGRITQATNWWDVTYIDGRVQRHTARTFYARMGDYVGLLATLASGVITLATLVLFFVKRKSKPQQGK